MSIDIEIGMLIGLAATCVGGLFVMVAMYLLGIRDERRGPPGHGFDDPLPEPPPIPRWEMNGPLPGPRFEVPDYVPDEWVREAA